MKQSKVQKCLAQTPTAILTLKIKKDTVLQKDVWSDTEVTGLEKRSWCG